MLMKNLNLSILLLLCVNLTAINSFAHTITREWSSPLREPDSKDVLIYGSSLTLGLVLFRNDSIERLQENVQKNRFMSEDLSHFGDIMGQLVPNLLYIGSQYFFENKSEGSRRIKVMAKSTFYAGLTTMILKGVVGQKRPNSENRLSFPSGHTTTAFAFASVVASEHDWYWGTSAYALATIVGLSRVQDNAHYIHDVVMGATIGTSFGIALSQLSKQKNNPNESYSFIPINNGFLLRKQMAF